MDGSLCERARARALSLSHRARPEHTYRRKSIRTVCVRCFAGHKNLNQHKLRNLIKLQKKKNGPGGDNFSCPRAHSSLRFRHIVLRTDRPSQTHTNLSRRKSKEFLRQMAIDFAFHTLRTASYTYFIHVQCSCLVITGIIIMMTMVDMACQGICQYLWAHVGSAQSAFSIGDRYGGTEKKEKFPIPSRWAMGDGWWACEVKKRKITARLGITAKSSGFCMSRIRSSSTAPSSPPAIGHTQDSTKKQIEKKRRRRKKPKNKVFAPAAWMKINGTFNRFGQRKCRWPWWPIVVTFNSFTQHMLDTCARASKHPSKPCIHYYTRERCWYAACTHIHQGIRHILLWTVWHGPDGA